MSTYTASPHKGGQRTVTHSKDDSLTAREYELLLEGASRLESYYQQQAEFVILVCGRLGLRRGELTHLRHSWLDARNEMVVIPEHERCHGERNGNGICGQCRQLAEQRATHNEHISLDEALAAQWRAKTPAAAREVYYGFDARLRLHLERFFESYDGWEWSANAVNRRIKKAAEHADELEPSDVRPHSLRATAATYHAGRGLEMSALMQMFGWAQPQTAERYLARNSRNTARQLDSIHQG